MTQLAPGREGAAGRPLARRGRAAGNAERGCAAPVERGIAPTQPAGVRVGGGLEQLVARALLDDPAGVHHRDPAARLATTARS